MHVESSLPNNSLLEQEVDIKDKIYEGPLLRSAAATIMNRI